MSNAGDAVKADHDIATTDNRASSQEFGPEAVKAANDERDAKKWREQESATNIGAHEGNRNKFDGLQSGLTRTFGEHRDDYVRTKGDLPAGVDEAMLMAENDYTIAFSKIRSTENDLARYLTDDSIYPAAKLNEAANRLKAANDEVDERLETAGLMLEAVEAELTAATRPKVKDGEGLEARADARMLLDGATGVAGVQTAIQRVVANSDGSLAGLLTDPAWMDTYMASRGFAGTELESMRSQIRQAHIQRAERADDPKRRAAAIGLKRVTSIRNARSVVLSARPNVDPRPSR